MPLYEYTCEACGAARQDVRKIDERHDAPKCDRCKQPMTLVIWPVHGYMKNPAVLRRQK